MFGEGRVSERCFAPSPSINEQRSWPRTPYGGFGRSRSTVTGQSLALSGRKPSAPRSDRPRRLQHPTLRHRGNDIVGAVERKNIIRRHLAQTSRRGGSLAGDKGRRGRKCSGLWCWPLQQFQAQSAIDCGKPLSAPAIVGATAPSSATSSEQRGSALPDSGKSMVARMA
jgi:hypothetical protein